MTKKKRRAHENMEFDLVVRDGYEPIIKLKNQRLAALGEVLEQLNKKLGGKR